MFVDAEPAIRSLDTILDRLGLAHKVRLQPFIGRGRCVVTRWYAAGE